MSVIIRLQNLPWSANALDIRQFFKGLSIPEGGVHIVGGEMGDAFIAFSTDEDARQAMMKDCSKLNEVQIRLLLSSRAEMQKVIETARQQSLLALQKAGAIAATPALSTPTTTPLPTPQPPVITTNNLQNILGTQLGTAPSFQVYQQQARVTLAPAPTPNIKAETSSGDTDIKSRRESNESLSRDRRRSTSRERRRSRSKDRNDRSSKRRRERSRSRSRDRDRRSGRQQRSTRRSRSRERSRDRSRERVRNGSRSNRNSRDDNSSNRLGRENASKSAGKTAEMKANEKPASISPWSIPPINAYQTDVTQNVNNTLMAHMQQKNIVPSGVVSNAYTTSVVDATNNINTLISNPMTAVLPGFQNFNNTITPNNYNANALSNPLATPLSGNDAAAKSSFALQNPYTAALRSSTSNSNSQECNRSPAMQFDTNLQQQQQTTTPFPNSVLDNNMLISQQNLQSLGTAQTIATAQANLIQQQQQQQQPIAFANTNPYAQIYPSLFAQAAAASTGIAPSHTTTSQNLGDGSPNAQDKIKSNQRSNMGNSQGQRNNNNNNNGKHDDMSRSCSIKITNMCVGTTYSDLRKFFSGLFIPHNGIKMVNDKFGERTGVAYIQFSRNSCVAKAMVRNNTILRTKRVSLEIVSDEEFRNIEDSYKPGRDREGYNRYDQNDSRGTDGNIGANGGGEAGARGGYENRRDGRGYDQKSTSPSQTNDDNENVGDVKANKQATQVSQEPFSVLFIEEIPAMTTEHDIMKMFSNYTIFDILLTVSPENRREFTAFVKFSREEEARAALLESSRHVIGRRKVRTRAAKEDEMERAKEKLRLANEQLKKEEEEEEEATKNADQKEIRAKGINKNETGMDGMDVEDETNDRNNSNEFGDNGPNEYQNMHSPTDRSVRDSPSDPRLRRQRHNNFIDDNMDDIGINVNGRNLNMNMITNMIRQQIESNSGGGGGPNFNQLWKPPSFQAMQMNSIENNFVILKNCDYNTHMNDVAQLMISANFVLKHIEPLRNGRQMFTGEFIVEFSNSTDASMAVKRFNNTLFRNRNLRVRAIQPQEIADRIGKPFMNYFPGGRGPPQRNPINMRGNFDFSNRGFGDRNNNFRMGGGHMGMDNFPRFGNNRSRGGTDGMDGRRSRPMRGNFNNRRNFHNSEDKAYNDDSADRQSNDTDDNNADKSDNGDDVVSVSSNGGDGASEVEGMATGIPEKFNQPGCVIAMENVPYKADLKDIIEFFKDFGVSHDDVIRRFNDDGSPTGDARVAFSSPTKAREALEAKKQQMILKRTIRLSMV